MIISFVPLRGGSKSISLKNIKSFCGKPLSYWLLNSLNSATLVDKIVVATDSFEIKNVVESFKFKKLEVYIRDSQNAQDISTTESVMIEYLNKCSFDQNDLFILGQATTPFTTSNVIDNAIRYMIENNFDSLLTCVKFKRFLWNSENKPINYDFYKRPRRQDYEGLWLENGAFYINKIGNILKYKNRLSGDIGIYEMQEYSSVEIDEENDWILAESIMKKYILSITGEEKIKIKLFLSDVDGTLTDSGMYYSNDGNEFKKFNTRDGKGFEILRNLNIKTGLITSEDTSIVTNRAIKLNIDFLRQGVTNNGKLKTVLDICENLQITLKEVAYIGDDVNCLELLSKVGLAACPSNSSKLILDIENIHKMNNKGGEGAVREFIDYLITNSWV